MNDLTVKARIQEAAMELFAEVRPAKEGHKASSRYIAILSLKIRRSHPVGITRSRIGPIA